MALLGKILIFINLGISVMVAALSVGLYTNRVDWTRGGKEGRPPGELDQREKDVRRYMSAVGPSVKELVNNKSSLLKIETGGAPQGELALSEDRAWYDQELARLRTGTTDQNPLQKIVVNGGVVQLDPQTQRPRMAPLVDRNNNRILSLTEYDAKEMQLLKEISDEETRLKNASEKAFLLVEQMTGKIDPASIQIDPATMRPNPDLVRFITKGIHQRILDEKDKLAKVKQEITIVEPLYVNALVDSELIVKRRNQLELRLTELRKQAENAAGE